MPVKNLEGQTYKVVDESEGSHGRLRAVDTERFANWLKLYQSRLHQTLERSLAMQRLHAKDTSRVER